MTRTLPTSLLFALVASQLWAQTPAKKLSLQEAIQAAVENNLQVSVARQTREASRAGVLTAEGTFDFVLGSNASISSIKNFNIGKQSTGTLLVNTETETTTSSRGLSISGSKLFNWGGQAELSYQPSYSYTKAQQLKPVSLDYTSSTPYDGTLSLTYKQPLLRNFGRDVTESGLVIARKGAQMADLTFQKNLIDLVAQVENYYWDMVYAERNLINKRQSLALAEKQLKENKIRVEVGTMAPIEITAAEATVAQREQEIITAEVTLQNARDTLLRALFPDKAQRPGDVELADAPTISVVKIEEAEAEKIALENRVELKNAQLDFETKLIQERTAESRLKPQLDLSISYSGNAGNRDTLGPVNGDLWGGKYPGYTVGLAFSMPIQNRAAKGTLASARAGRMGADYSRKDLIQSVLLDVRQSLRTIQAAEKGVKAAEKTRVFREKNLEAEQKKFENGMSTNFFVLQRQDELDSAKASELQAQIVHAKSVTQLDRSLGRLLEARKIEVK